MRRGLEGGQCVEWLMVVDTSSVSIVGSALDFAR